MYKRLTEKALKRCGRRCIIKPFGSDEQLTVTALINPLLHKNKMYIGGTYLPDGFCDGGHYLYIGEPSVSLDNMPIGSVIVCGENTYSIKHSEQYFIGSDVLYTWAILQLAERGEGNG